MFSLQRGVLQWEHHNRGQINNLQSDLRGWLYNCFKAVFFTDYCTADHYSKVLITLNLMSTIFVEL